jgi:hypothetical protein
MEKKSNPVLYDPKDVQYIDLSSEEEEEEEEDYVEDIKSNTEESKYRSSQSKLGV